jgi:hypothetical protein
MAITQLVNSEYLPIPSPKSRLRVGVILDARLVPRWIRRILQEIGESKFAELALIIMANSNASVSASAPVFREDAPALLRLWWRLDRRLFGHRSAKPHALDLVWFIPQGAHPELLESTPVKFDSGFSFAEVDFEKIMAGRLDVLLSVGTGTPDPRLQKSAKFGVWTFKDAAQSLASLFWTLYNNSSVVTNELHVSSPWLGSSTVLCSCFAADRYSFFRNYINLCWNRSPSVMRELKNLHQGLQPMRDSRTALATLRQMPVRNSDLVRLVPRLLKRAASDQLRKRLMRERWFIAFRKISVEGRPAEVGGEFTLITPPHGRSYADPFVVERNGKNYIFFEDYSYERGKAVISFIEVDPDGQCSAPEVALEEDHHLSFPCVFQWRDEVYLLPETKNNRTIQLYRTTDFPRGWQLSHVLLRGVAAVDSTLFHHKGKFWLFTSGIRTEGRWFGGDSELFLFFSDSLFGPWKAHPRNPIATDVRNCRSAGQLYHWNGELIRPAQDCSTVYGRAVVLNRVDVLSEFDYLETPVATISPEWMRNNLGTHTFNCNHQYEVLDGRTLVRRFFRSVTNSTIETVTPLAPVMKYR